MEQEKLKDWALIFFLAFFWVVTMRVVETILESFVQSVLLADLIQIAVGAAVLGFLLSPIFLLFKGEEYQEFVRKTRKSRYTVLLIVLPLIILPWIIQSQVVDPLLGNLPWRTVGTIIFILILLIIAIVVDRKFKKEWREFKQQSS